MKVLIKRGVKDRGEWKPCQRIFTPTGDFLGQPKAVKEPLSSDTFPFFFFSFSHGRIEMKRRKGNSSPAKGENRRELGRRPIPLAESVV